MYTRITLSLKLPARATQQLSMSGGLCKLALSHAAGPLTDAWNAQMVLLCLK